MAYPVWESTANASNNGTLSDLACNKPSGVVSGDLLLAFCATQGGGFTTTKPSGWTLGDDPTDPGMYCWKIAGGSEPSDYTFTGNGAAARLITIHRISGVDTSAPINATVRSSKGGFSTTATADSISPSVAETLRFIASLTNLSTAADTPSGFTSAAGLTGTNLAQRVSWINTAASGATGTVSFGCDLSSNERIFHIAIAPAAGGGGGGSNNTGLLLLGCGS